MKRLLRLLDRGYPILVCAAVGWHAGLEWGNNVGFVVFYGGLFVLNVGER